MEKPFFQRLRERRVPQLVSLYLGCSWALLQFIDWLVKRYLLSRHLTDAALLILASLLPAVCLLAYTHGAPGRDRWGKAEKVGVPANLLLTAALVFTLFAGKDLGAASRTVKTVDEEGRQVERLVPKEDSKRRLAIYFFDSGRDDPEARWLRFGVPILLAADLNQDPFVVASTPFSGWQGRSLERLQRAGFRDGLDMPRSLMRHVTEERHLERFVAGRVERRDDGYEIAIELYGVDGPADALDATSVAGDDFFALIDDLTVWLKERLEVHEGGSRLADDLSMADRYSESVEALRHHVEGQLAVVLENDYQAAIESLEQAVSIDPTFAAAHLALSQAYAQQGGAEPAKKAILKALQHEYKLSERQRLAAKGWKYFVDGELAKRAALYEMWMDLYPDDVEAQTTLAYVYMWTGNRLDDAGRAFERALELDPAADWILRQLADLRATQGDFEAALELHRRYGERHPEDPVTSYHIGRVHQRAGDLEAARGPLEKAILLSNGLVTPILALADVEMREGRLEKANLRLDDAAAMATTPSQKSLVLRRRVELLQVTGRLQAALDLMPELLEQEQQFRQPIDVAILRMIFAELYVEAGRGAEMESIVEGYAGLLQAPIDGFLHLGHLLLAVGRDDVEAIERHRESFEDFLRGWERDDFLFVPMRAHGRALELRGERAAAADAYRRAIELHATSTNQGLESFFEERLRTRLARLERERGRPEAAAEQLERVFRYFPAFPQANLEMARLLAATGNEAGARAHLEKAREMLQGADPGLAPAEIAAGGPPAS